MTALRRGGRDVRRWFCPFDNTWFTDEQVSARSCPRCGGELQRIEGGGVR